MRRLTNRERGLLSLLAVIATGALLIQGFFFFGNARGRAEERIASLERDVEQLSLLAGEMEQLKAEETVWLAAMEEAGPISTFLEQTASELGLGAANIVSITAQPAERGDDLTMEPVRLRMKGLTLNQLVDYLYLIEASRSDLWLREMTITPDPSVRGEGKLLNLNLEVVRVASVSLPE